MADLTANGQIYDYTPGNAGSISAQITGTFTATLSFRCSVDGVTFFDLNMFATNNPAAVSSVTAPNLVRVTVSGLKIIRFIVTAFTSGTITVKVAPGVMAGSTPQ